MNEHLSERFGRSRRGVRPPNGQAVVLLLPPQLNLKVRQYFEDSKKPVDGGLWLDRPEIPTSAEVLDKETGGSHTSSEVELKPNLRKGAYGSKGKRPNRPEGSWESRDEYLGTHYELLREDAVRGLREAVGCVKFTPEAKEDAFNGAIGIYDKVHICEVIPSTRGLAIRVTFSLFRIGKKVLWEQSKRLITGSLVVLTPATDMFKHKAIVATVAARPVSALEQDPPELDLFIARPEELEIDPAIEWVMVEDRRGLYEAHRHTLLALQKMMREPFPLKEHLVSAQREVSAPTYVEEHPITDLSTILQKSEQDTYENVDILHNWPKNAQSKLDSTQLDALERILTKKLAIIQGPPGTGKTFISTEAVRIILANRHRDDPPIIIACQTNHAVDQLLNQIASFESDFIRLGGRSKDKGVVKQRTLYEVRQQTAQTPLAGGLGPNARKRMKQLSTDIKTLLSPFLPNKTPLDVKLLHHLGLLTEQQATSLIDGASQWVQSKLDNPNQSPFTIWLGKALVSVPPKQMPDNYGFDYEEAEQAVEQIREAEAENVTQDDEEFDRLRGDPIPIADNFTCRKPIGKTQTKDMEAAKTSLKEKDLWKIPDAARPAVYRFLQTQAKIKIRDALREKMTEFNNLAINRRTGMWEEHETLLKKQKIIGMTTTGFSKYRGLLAALGPKIVVIEEAAETLEAPVAVTCLPSLQQLILVGDHMQLRPQCHVKAHQEDPFYLNISLFERLLNNKLPLTTLGVQRRMIPEVRRLLYPIYGNKITDHPSVTNPTNRPNVPGMGGVNSFFFNHEWSEQTDDYMSKFNAREADMIVGFVKYLFFNGVPTRDITILTFYNGQRMRIHSELKKRPHMINEPFDVRTVDSYQGEQNKVIILSLARSNDYGQMGFLSVNNRICVALSRAQCGLYIFGNAFILYGNLQRKWPGHEMWKDIIDIMLDNRRGNPKMVRNENRLKVEPVKRVSNEGLPVRCANHGTITEINDEYEWDGITGGCKVTCKSELPCGHPCPLTCHPFSHDKVVCDAECRRVLSCGHECSGKCGEPCSCKKCSKGRGKLTEATNLSHAANKDQDTKLVSRISTPERWNAFAEGEPVRYASAAASATSSLRSSPEKIGTAPLTLVDVGVENGVDGLSLADSDSSGSSTYVVSSTQQHTNGSGSRKKWKDVVGGGGMGGEKKDWSREGSLLDREPRRSAAYLRRLKVGGRSQDMESPKITGIPSLALLSC